MDILDEVAVSMHCSACSGEYQVPLKQVLPSRQTNRNEREWK